jgi:hypothetical protein
MRNRLRKINKANESLGADLKAARIQLVMLQDTITELEGELATRTANLAALEEKVNDSGLGSGTSEGEA